MVPATPTALIPSGWLEPLPGLVVAQLLEEGAADALGDAARDLARDDGRIDQHAAVVHQCVATEAEVAGCWIDLDDRRLLPAGAGYALRRVEAVRPRARRFSLV
jgi:hypothetical protein